MKFILFSLIIFPFVLTAQINPPNGELFTDNLVPRMDIYIHPDSLAWLYDEENLASDYYFHADFSFDNGTVQQDFDNVGFRLRGNVANARKEEKKSFKISLNTYEPGRKFEGIEKINLNAITGDVTLSRPKFCSDLRDFMGLPAIRSNHVRLYINDEYKGVYLNAEQVDEEFIKSRFGNKSGNLYKAVQPSDLNFISDNPRSYINDFELKTNKHVDDFSDLSDFIDVLNNTPIELFPCEFEKVFNIDNYLKIIAFDILTGNWDGYIWNANNYYLYHNLETDLFEFIGHDFDLTFGTDWVGLDWTQRNIYSWSRDDEYRPLYERIMQIPMYKERVTYYLLETINQYFNENLFEEIDATKDLIKPYAEIDTFLIKPWFTFDDFLQAFDQVPPQSISDYGIKDYIKLRIESIQDQAIISDIAPIISNIKNNHPLENFDLIVTAKVMDDQEVQSVEICYESGSNSQQTCLFMNDNGTDGDPQADDQIYTGIVPALAVGELKYFIKATDNNQQETSFPSCGNKVLNITNENNINLSLNELMASNETIHSDGKGEFDDWIEIYNYGNTPIFLGDKYLSDNGENINKWKMPNIFIHPKRHLVFWADKDEGQGDFHTNFKLSSAGEEIGIYLDESISSEPIDFLLYENQETDIPIGRNEDGRGEWTTSLIPTPGKPNLNIGEEAMDIEINLYPNPASSILQLDLINHEEQELIISLFNNMGKKFFQITTDEFLVNKQFDLDSLISGIYFVRIVDQFSVSRSEKIMIIK